MAVWPAYGSLSLPAILWFQNLFRHSCLPGMAHETTDQLEEIIFYSSSTYSEYVWQYLSASIVWGFALLVEISSEPRSKSLGKFRDHLKKTLRCWRESS